MNYVSLRSAVLQQFLMNIKKVKFPVKVNLTLRNRLKCTFCDIYVLKLQIKRFETTAEHHLSTNESGNFRSRMLALRTPLEAVDLAAKLLITRLSSVVKRITNLEFLVF